MSSTMQRCSWRSEKFNVTSDIMTLKWHWKRQMMLYRNDVRIMNYFIKCLKHCLSIYWRYKRYVSWTMIVKIDLEIQSQNLFALHNIHRTDHEEHRSQRIIVCNSTVFLKSVIKVPLDPALTLFTVCLHFTVR